MADRKKTDIQLAATRGEQKVVIEVKIAGSWSLRQLEQALRAQLVGQYLQDDTCRAGCLLLTYDGKKKYWKHAERGQLSFPEVMEHLKRAATAIEKARGYEVLLAAFGGATGRATSAPLKQVSRDLRGLRSSGGLHGSAMGRTPRHRASPRAW